MGFLLLARPGGVGNPPALGQEAGGQPLAGLARKVPRLGAKGAIRRHLADYFGLPSGADELWVHYVTPPWAEGQQRTIYVRPRAGSGRVDVLLIRYDLAEKTRYFYLTSPQGRLEKAARLHEGNFTAIPDADAAFRAEATFWRLWDQNPFFATTLQKLDAAGRALTVADHATSRTLKLAADVKVLDANAGLADPRLAAGTEVTLRTDAEGETVTEIRFGAVFPGRSFGKSETATAIRFVNHSGQTIRVHWLGFDGNRKFYKALADGQEYEQPTFLGHPWLVTDQNDNPWYVYLPQPKARTVTVTNPARE